MITTNDEITGQVSDRTHEFIVTHPGNEPIDEVAASNYFAHQVLMINIGYLVTVPVLTLAPSTTCTRVAWIASQCIVNFLYLNYIH